MPFSEVPESSPVKGVVTGAALGLLGNVPVVGGLASGALAAAVAAKQRTRDEEYWAWTAARVTLLEARHGQFFDPADDEFLAAVHRTLRAARETADRQKRQMLAEAVANAGSWSTTDLNRRERYLDLISTLTPGHIRILRYLSSPQGWFAKHRPEAISEISNSYMQSVGQVLSRYFFEGDEELARRGFDAVSDLVAERLVQVDLSTIGTGPGALESRTTADGESLLSFLGDIGEDPTA